MWTTFDERHPSLKNKTVRMWAISLNYPDDGRRSIELRSNSEWLAQHIKEEIRAYGNDFVHTDEIDSTQIDKEIVRDVIDNPQTIEIVLQRRNESDGEFYLRIVKAEQERIKKVLGL
jgi:hypothetical protein